MVLKEIDCNIYVVLIEKYLETIQFVGLFVGLLKQVIEE